MEEFQIDFPTVDQQLHGKGDGLKELFHLWLVATAGGIAVIFVLGIFFYGSYQGVGGGG